MKEIAATTSVQAPNCEPETEELFNLDIPEEMEPEIWPECCIYKVPRPLRGVNEIAYTPQVVSIGPLHNTDPRAGSSTCRDDKFTETEKQKLRYLAEFCKRTGKTPTQLAMEIRKHEVRIRRCYQETFEQWSSNEFVKMILLDSVFIIELFCRTSRIDHFKSTDVILRQPWLMNSVADDLLLLENQIPYFVMQDLYDFARRDLTTTNPWPSFYMLTCCFFYIQKAPPKLEGKENPNCNCDCFSLCFGFWLTKCFSCRKSNDDQNSNQLQPHKNPQDFEVLVRKFEAEEKPKHLVDLLRKFLLYNRPVNEPKSTGDGVCHSYSATKLHESGVTFQVAQDLWPLNIKFESGVLEMPRFHVSGRTQVILRNLMAFEQRHYPGQGYISNYVLVLDFLINTEADVDLLIRQGIITNLLGDSKAVADMVNKLNHQILVENFCYNDVCLKLNKHYKNSWFRTVAVMKSVYFSNLWTGTGTIAAAVLLLLTLLQTIFTIKK